MKRSAPETPDSIDSDICSKKKKNKDNTKICETAQQKV